MTRYRAGDESVFDELYRRTAPRLYSHLLRLTRHRQRAEDALQNTFVKLHRSRQRYTPGLPVMPWLLVIARRCLFDEQRGVRFEREHVTRSGQLPDRPEPPAAESIADQELLWSALDQLTPRAREAIELTKLQGYSVAEAAALLDTTPMAVKLRVHRGSQRLRELLATLSPSSLSAAA